MTRFAAALRVLSVVGFVAIVLAFFVRFSNVGAPPSLSKLSLALILAGALVGAPAGVALARHFRRNPGYLGSRSPIALGFASAALGAGFGLMVVLTLLPGPTNAATSVEPGGRVARISPGSWRCLNQVLIESVSSRIYLCACHRGTCVRGFSQNLAVGDRVNIQLSTNWAGSRIVGLVLDGA
jgi:hypothetical protein